MNKVAYRKFAGINNVDDSTTLIDRSRGMIIPLIQAENVDLHKDGHLSRPHGYTKVISGDYDVWANDSICLAVNNGNLVRINSDYTTTLLMSGIGDYAMAYETVYDDTGMRIYFTNGMIIGKIKNGVASLLGETTEELKSVLPPGNMLKYFFGRLYLIKGKIIYVSDILNKEIYDRRWGFKQFETTITMFEGLDDGVYVSDSEAVFYMKQIFEVPEDIAPTSVFALTLVDDSPAIPGTAIKVKNIRSPSGALHKQAVIWKSDKSLCFGGDGGTFERGLEGVYNTSHFQRGTAVFRKDGDLNQYITILK